MSTLTSDQAMTVLRASALPALKGEHPVTQRVIAAIPPDKAAYRPDEIMRSAIDLAWHIVASEVRFLEAVATGAFDFSGGARPDHIRTPDEHHRGQLSMYLRPMGAKVPSIYGESFDARAEREAREKAKGG
jgi:uncharacterized damage-inducible protein DinB